MERHSADGTEAFELSIRARRRAPLRQSHAVRAQARSGSSRSEVFAVQTGPTSDPTSTGWQRFFRLVFNRSSIAMTLLDDGRVTVAVNQAMCEYLKRPRDEMIDRKVDVDVSPPTLRRFQAAWESLIQVGDGVVNVEVVRSDGVVLHSEFAARTATIDGRRLVLGVLLAGAPISFSVAISRVLSSVSV